jgi:uncharacterized hydrophobic protein (TIGR00271 family)
MLTSFLNKIKKLIDIESDADRQSAIAQIKNDVYLRGSNIFYLICSALIASVGLDVSSPAVIIGAMLISPLMSPILGIGLSLGIHDKENFFISVREFTLSVLLGLFVSTVYFALTPLGNSTTEILSRIKPTALDIIIAFFGGVAGIVAVTRSKIASALPGVAIATALMPPICVAGFGLASAQFEYFFGAIYLFFINAVFISFSSYLIVRYLKFPFKEYPDSKRLFRTKLIITTTVIIVAVPSFFIFYGVIKDVRLNQNVEKFVKKEIQSKDLKVIEWKYIPQKDTNNILSVYLVGKSLTVKKQDSLSSLLVNYNIERTKINFTQLSDDKGLEHMKGELKTDLLSTIKIVQKSNEEQNKTIKKEIYENDSVNLANIIYELKVFYPEIEEIGFTNNYINENMKKDTFAMKRMPILKIQWNSKIKNSELKLVTLKIYSIVKNKLKTDTLTLINLN